MAAVINHSVSANARWLRALCRRFIPVSTEYDGDKFFTVENGVRTATPLLLALAVVELSDVVFAVDSVPAVSSCMYGSLAGRLYHWHRRSLHCTACRHRAGCCKTHSQQLWLMTGLWRDKGSLHHLQQQSVCHSQPQVGCIVCAVGIRVHGSLGSPLSTSSTER